MNIRLKLRRVGMFILFVGALYTTVLSITNMTLTDMTQWMNESKVVEATTKYSSQNVKDRKTHIKDKHLPFRSEDSQEHFDLQLNDVKSLEDLLNFEEYSRETVIATGYTAGIESTGKTPDHPGYGITFSGVEVKLDIYSSIAADLDIYPLGTIMYIPGYGYGVVADKGSAISGNKIDLYYETVEDVFAEWGKKEVDVYIIERGDGHLTEEQFAAFNAQESLQVLGEQILSE